MTTQNTPTQKIEEIPDGQVFTIVATEVESFIGGAYKAGFYNDGRITLVYTDKTTEMAKFDIWEAQSTLDMGLNNFLIIVNEVQLRRDKVER